MQLLDAVSEHRWYHVLELPDGTTTPGWFDLRPYVHHYGIPDDLTGKRVLDVGTWDGFWAFELERRGAEVVALDLDDERDLDFPPRRRPASYRDTPRGTGFHLAKQLLSSNVERVNMSIYDARPEELGTFDLVFCGSVIMHLRDQLLALERIAGVCTGTFITTEEYDRIANLVPLAVSRYHADRDKAVVFWLPNIRTWKRMLWTAGFDRVERHAKFSMHTADGNVKVPHVVHHAHKH